MTQSKNPFKIGQIWRIGKNTDGYYFDLVDAVKKHFADDDFEIIIDEGVSFLIVQEHKDQHEIDFRHVDDGPKFAFTVVNLNTCTKYKIFLEKSGTTGHHPGYVKVAEAPKA